MHHKIQHQFLLKADLRSCAADEGGFGKCTPLVRQARLIQPTLGQHSIYIFFQEAIFLLDVKKNRCPFTALTYVILPLWPTIQSMVAESLQRKQIQ